MTFLNFFGLFYPLSSSIAFISNTYIGLIVPSSSIKWLSMRNSMFVRFHCRQRRGGPRCRTAYTLCCYPQKKDKKRRIVRLLYVYATILHTKKTQIDIGQPVSLYSIKKINHHPMKKKDLYRQATFICNLFTVYKQIQ